MGKMDYKNFTVLTAQLPKNWKKIKQKKGFLAATGEERQLAAQF